MDRIRAISTPDGPFEIPFSKETLIRAGVTSEANAEQCVRLYSAWLLLLADSPLNKTMGMKRRRVFSHFSKILFSRPVKDTIVLMASLADDILRSTTLYGIGSVTGDFISPMSKTPVFMEYRHWLRSGDAALLQYVHTFLVFGKKAEFVDESLEPDALRKWEAVEQRIGNVVYGDSVRPLRRLLDLCLRQPARSLFLPKHGPGTVMGGKRSISDKVKQFEYDPHIDRVFFQHFSSTNLEERLGYDPAWVLPEPEKWIEARFKYKQHLHHRFERSSELIFAKKDIRSLRTICREHTTPMFFQQGVLQTLLESIRSGVIGQTVTIEDQEPSRQMCIEGSIYGNLDTIDLSSASDSVSWRLVKLVFPKWVIPRLMATRSSVVKMPDGRHYSVEKFAPMGSAVCFPVQCILYWAVTASCYLKRKYGDGWHEVLDDITILSFLSQYNGIGGDPPKGRLAPFRIYGDDIICDTHCTEDVAHLLNDLGFEVNEGKSFQSSQAVRESCGMFAWAGWDVTPLRYRVKHLEGANLDMESVASLVELANHAGDRKYRHLRRWCLGEIFGTEIAGVHRRAGMANPIPFVDDPTQWGVYQPNGVRNSHLRLRQFLGQEDDTTCSRYQRDEVKVVYPYVKSTGLDLSDPRQRHEYTAWWRAKVTGSDSYLDLLRGAPFYLRTTGPVVPKWVWTPTG